MPSTLSEAFIQLERLFGDGGPGELCFDALPAGFAEGFGFRWVGEQDVQFGGEVFRKLLGV